MILTPESRALLKRMDADDAINKAVELALEAAAQVCEARISIYSDEDEFGERIALEAAASSIRALKDQK